MTPSTAQLSRGAFLHRTLGGAGALASLALLPPAVAGARAADPANPAPRAPAEAQLFLGIQEVVTERPLRLGLDRRPFI